MNTEPAETEELCIVRSQYDCGNLTFTKVVETIRRGYVRGWEGTAEGMGRGTDRSIGRWEKAAHALCGQVSAEEMEQMGPGWLTRYLSQRVDLSKKAPHK